jgi:hypothetical protein
MTAALAPAHPRQSVETDVADLLLIIAEGLPVDSDHYPELPSEGSDVDRFCIRHSALHFAKTAGQLAAVAEATDHGGTLDRSRIAQIAAASLVNSLKLANEIGLSASEMCALVSLKLSR